MWRTWMHPWHGSIVMKRRLGWLYTECCECKPFKNEGLMPEQSGSCLQLEPRLGTVTTNGGEYAGMKLTSEIV